ncbi:MAG: COG4315 family predicted lipoprotein [Acidimicrobiales bacterium]
MKRTARAHVGAPLALEAVGALLLAATGAVHLDLYFDGYGPLPTIGTLFVLQAAVSFALAIFLLAARHPLLDAAGALFALATLGGYLISLLAGLFGFREVPTTDGILAGALEVAAFAVLGGAAARRFGAQPYGAHLRRAGYLSAPPVTVAAALALALSLSLVQPAGAGGAAGSGRGRGPNVVVIGVKGYGKVLATPARMSLYLLSDEGEGRVTCNSGCLSIWPPLLLPRDVKAPRPGRGISGRLGLLRRGSREQVSYNGYPLYTYAGDPGPAASAGQGIVSFGGTWYLVRASAVTRGQTAVTRRP